MYGKKSTDTISMQSIFFISIFLVMAAFISGCNPYNCDNLPEAYQDLEESTQYMYILWRPNNQSNAAFQKILFDDIAPALLDRSPRHLTIMATNTDVKSITLFEVPREDCSVVAALISVGVETRTEAEALAYLIKPFVSFVSGYEVMKTVPLDYEKNWMDGKASPGIQQVTFLKKRKDLDHESFKEYWFCSHTPFALSIHPLWRYERNEVIAPITENAPAYDGIVELHLHEVDDLTNLNRFFGGDVITNGLRIGLDVSQFIDMENIEVTAMTEYVIKSN